MLTRLTHGDVTWVDVVNPTSTEVRQLMDEFSLDPLIAEELTAPSVRNHVDGRDDYFYVVLNFPAFKHMHDMANTALELDFIVGKNWIITTRYSQVDPLHQFSTTFEVESVLNKKNMGEHAGYVFYYMLMELYRSLHSELVHIGNRLEDVEERVFQGDEREMVIELSHVARDLLNFVQALGPHREMLASIEKPGVALFGYEYARNVRSAQGEYDRLDNAIEGHHASLTELRETNNSLLTTKQNEVMKIFTIMAFVTFPLSLVSSIFGMNTKYIPIIGHPWDFWIIIGGMLSAAIAFFAYFKYKNWL
jgi:magnesium transporter